jgi:hypothetical protein
LSSSVTLRTDWNNNSISIQIQFNIINTEPSTTSVGEDAGKKVPSFTAGGSASWCNHSGKKIGGFLKI